MAAILLRGDDLIMASNSKTRKNFERFAIIAFRPRQNDRNFTEHFLNWIFLNESELIFIRISLTLINQHCLHNG